MGFILFSGASIICDSSFMLSSYARYKKELGGKRSAFNFPSISIAIFCVIKKVSQPCQVTQR